MDIRLEELSAAQQAALKQFIQTLSTRVKMAYIFCFALQRRESSHQHCFGQQAVQQRFQADVLLVYSDQETRPASAIQSLANSLSGAEHQYAAVAMGRTEAIQQFEGGNPFVVGVFSRGALLYSSELALPRRQGYVCHKTWLQQIRQGWIRWFNTSCQFMDCATYCLMDDNFAMAVFMVHQTVEQACKALIKVILNLGTNSHNLAWMLKLCSSLVPEIDAIFPRNDPKEKALFNLLKGSYIDCRYAASFEVREEEAWVLYYRANTLLRTIGSWCNDRIKTMATWANEGNGLLVDEDDAPPVEGFPSVQGGSL